MNWCTAGTSTNRAYVTLANPTTANMFHTVVHLACANGHATTEATAVANTWSFFTGRNVTTWNGIPLTYYSNSAPNSATTATLVRTHDGDCDAFANLLFDALQLNAIANIHLAHIRPATNHSGMGVKNIQFDDVNPAFPAEPIYKYDLDDLDVSPTGIPGQNMDPPSEKRFNYHRIVHRGSGTEYYDPSYGITTTGATNYAPNIDGWMRTSDYHWRKATGLGLFPVFEDD